MQEAFPIAFFGLFGKKEDVQKEIDSLKKEHQAASQKVCATCGRTYPLDLEHCPPCGTRLYVDQENFCRNPSCERHAVRHRFSHDDFTCDKCFQPTVVGEICGFCDPEE